MKSYDLHNAIKKMKIENVKIDHISKIGEGAWHDVYKIERDFEDDIVLRIKKKKAYGQFQEYDELDLITEYESSKAYYQQANQCSFDICPSFFKYFIDERLVFTVESFMGEGKPLQSLSDFEAYTIGIKLGEFFLVMHSKTPEIKGCGNLLWNGKHLEGNLQKDADQVWRNDNDFYVSVLDKLITADLKMNRNTMVDKLLNLIENRRNKQQKLSLVNQDVTPENIILNSDKVSLIDPFPMVDFDLKYAGYFVFCYKFLLPAYSTAPRYRNNAYDQNYSILSKIADGFTNGYIGDNENWLNCLKNECILWTLLETYDHYEILNKSELSYKTIQQMGSKDIINKRLTLCLKELERLCSTL
jgi:hypothetical protein